MVGKENREIMFSRTLRGSSLIIVSLILLIGGCLISLSSGPATISLREIWDAFLNFKIQNNEHLIIKDLRLPRTLAAIFVGAGFAVAGAMMQGVTQNPLADPGLLGVNAGAQFMLVIVFAFAPALKFSYIIYFCFIGGGIGALLVYGIAYLSSGAMTPVRLALSGEVVSAVLVGISQGLSILLELNYDMAFWSAGGVSGAEWTQVKVIIPWILLGLIIAVFLSSYITLLNLGDDMAVALGQRTRLIKICTAISVFLLAGAAVSTVGGVSFVGLLVPHIVRYLIGTDYRWIIPLSILTGAAVVLWADILAKSINAPYETPLGTIVSLVGVPFFIYLARKQRRELY